MPPHKVSDDERHAIDAYLIANLFRRLRPLLIANIGTALLFAASRWGQEPAAVLLGWAVALIGWTLLRVALAKAFMRRPRAPAEAIRWMRLFAVGSGVGGALWGSSVLLLGGTDPETERLLIVFVMAALSAAALSGYSINLLAFYAFLLPALLPYGITLVWAGGEPDLGIAAFGVLWLFLLTAMARNLNHGFRESIAVHLRNARLIETLARERDRAEAASEAKTRFLANMSHELRTPLNAIIGYSEMMARKVLGAIGNPRYEPYAENIHRSGIHLLKVVDEVLDVSRLEAGRMDLEEEDVDLAGVLAEARRTVAPMAEEDGIALTVHVPPDLPLLKGDRTKLLQIATNLASNAVKFTPPAGSVRIGAARSETGGLVIVVADTGVGIAAEDIDRVVIPFARLEEREHLKRARALKRDRGQTSNGLGLPLVRMLAELHGGTLEIASAPGAGTTVQVRFPPDRTMAAPAVPMRAAAPASR